MVTHVSCVFICLISGPPLISLDGYPQPLGSVPHPRAGRAHIGWEMARAPHSSLRSAVGIAKTPPLPSLASVWGCSLGNTSDFTPGYLNWAMEEPAWVWPFSHPSLRVLDPSQPHLPTLQSKSFCPRAVACLRCLGAGKLPLGCSTGLLV